TMPAPAAAATPPSPAKDKPSFLPNSSRPLVLAFRRSMPDSRLAVRALMSTVSAAKLIVYALDCVANVYYLLHPQFHVDYTKVGRKVGECLPDYLPAHHVPCPLGRFLLNR